MKKYDLGEDPEITALTNANKAARVQEMKEKEAKMKEALKVSPEQQKVIDDVISKFDKISTEPNMEGVLEWADYLKVFEIIVTLQIRFTITTGDSMKDARRAHLEAGNK